MDRISLNSAPPIDHDFESAPELAELDFIHRILSNPNRWDHNQGSTQEPYQGRFPVTLGYSKPEPRSISGYAWLHKNVTEVGSRLRSVTEKCKQGRFAFTHGKVSWLRNPVPGHAWIRKSVTQTSSRLRMILLVGFATRFRNGLISLI